MKEKFLPAHWDDFVNGDMTLNELIDSEWGEKIKKFQGEEREEVQRFAERTFAQLYELGKRLAKFKAYVLAMDIPEEEKKATLAGFEQFMGEEIPPARHCSEEEWEEITRIDFSDDDDREL